MTYLISKLIETERVGEGLTAGLKGEGNFDVTLKNIFMYECDFFAYLCLKTHSLIYFLWMRNFVREE